MKMNILRKVSTFIDQVFYEPPGDDYFNFNGLSQTSQLLQLLKDFKVTINELFALKKVISDGIITGEDSETRVVVDQLCFGLEKILYHGLRRDLFVFSETTIFDYLVNLPQCLPDTQNFVDILKTKCCKTNLGKGRAFIRLGLNEGVLSEYISSLVWNKPLTQKFYESHAIIRNPELITRLVTILDTLKIIAFALNTFTSDMDERDYWQMKRADFYNQKQRLEFSRSEKESEDENSIYHSKNFWKKDTNTNTNTNTNSNTNEATPGETKIREIIMH